MILLSVRECQVIRLLWDGLESRAIGARLGIGGACVRMYQMRAARKLGVPNSKVRILDEALKRGMIR